MCFTISYGLVRFPDAGILDAAQGVRPQDAGSSAPQKTEVLKPTVDGSTVQQNAPPASTALPENKATQDDLFVTESTTRPAKGAEVCNAENGYCSIPVDNPQDNASTGESNGEKNAANESGNSDLGSTSSVPANKTESVTEESAPKDAELPTLENEPDNNSNEQTLIGIPDDDKSAQDDSMPIETDLNPMPITDSLNSEVPSVIVDHNPPAIEPEPLSVDEPMQDELSIPGMTPEQEQTTEKYWDDYFKENSPSNSLSSNKDSAPSDTVTTENQPPAVPEPTTIKTDPNAQDIPAKNREQKSANKDAVTLPALDDPQNVAPNANQPDTGTIPLESFPLDASTIQNVNFTAECQQEPYDPFGFNIPATGPIVVKRLPSVDNSVDPIYNNAQLDRFAL